jgi:hypothetical protein
LPYKDKKRGLEMARKRYQSRKDNGVCVRCDNKAFPGIVICLECRSKQRTGDNKYRMIHRDKRNKHQRELKVQRLAEGKCYKCGSPLIEGEAKYCYACQTTSHSLKGVVTYATNN